MKYTITGILIIAAALLVWVWQAGNPSDAWMMLVAIVSVVFFGALGNLWNSLYPVNPKPKRRGIPSDAVVIKSSTFAASERPRTEDQPVASPSSPEAPPQR
ncbi:MAG: hypothetical protein KF859_01455 [Phycisphaeraceae bacterium]|nr:hypothetical protein [Phycisphaeraceae bacterium]